MQGLVKQENGAPLQMAGLATHLHYHEPSNYVLVSFLQRGLFHKICQPEENGKDYLISFRIQIFTASSQGYGRLESLWYHTIDSYHRKILRRRVEKDGARSKPLVRQTIPSRFIQTNGPFVPHVKSKYL